MRHEIKETIIQKLRTESCSCVLWKEGKMKIYREKGVKDLFRLLKRSPEELDGAFIADKIVGKGAAALMVLGGIKEVFADIISTAALSLLAKNGIRVEFGTEVPHIINRNKTGICPVEILCRRCETAAECLPLIEGFLEEGI